MITKEEAVDVGVETKGTAFRIGQTDTWFAKIPVVNDENSADSSPLALHFVLDNSMSMGKLTDEVKNEFSPLIDGAASKPSSLTVFHDKADVLSPNIGTTKEMMALQTGKQGMTNIPAGVKRAVDTIIAQEKDNANTEKTHHILVLLTDGMHNSGPPPETRFPKIGKHLRESVPDVQLSVVVVGITKNSSTSMGMLLKTSLETVPLSSDCVDTIYFAPTTKEMSKVTSKLVDGLINISRGQIIKVSHAEEAILADMGAKPTSTTTVRSLPSDKDFILLFECSDFPGSVQLDNGTTVQLAESEDPSYDQVAELLQKHLEKTRVQRVASDMESVRSSVARLGVLIDALEGEMKKSYSGLHLAKARAVDRLTQNRAVTTIIVVARELRNQLAEIANFAAQNSEEQAAFLNGKYSKFASKALRRAAGDDKILDVKKVLKAVHTQVSGSAFSDRLTASLRQDATAQVANLTEKQVKRLKMHVKAAPGKNTATLQELLMWVRTRRSEFDHVEEQSESKMEEKVVTSALCWIPPEESLEYDAIQKIRKNHDRQVKRWPPHVNLLYPFVPANQFEAASKKLAVALSSSKPFDVTLDSIGCFAHSKKSFTSWIHPKETDRFIQLQEICQETFPHCDDLSSRGPFVPHLTVGQCGEQKEADELEIEASWKPMSSQCGEICLISRKGKDDPFEIHWRVWLGDLTPIPNGTMSDKVASDVSTKKDCDKGNKDIFSSMSPRLQQFIDSGVLAGHINEVFFGHRQSYLSLLNAWEHIAEWRDLAGVDFKSQWELLLYAGSLAYPISVERSPAAQMNPFLLRVTKVNTTAIDTASLCCANHSSIDVYGPEGGEPIKDALVLVDPLCPRASAAVLRSKLLGETFTSVTVSRDLHMYTGASMKIAVMAHSLFCCFQPEPISKTSVDIVAEIRRQFLGNAYQCSSCGFGPVDHGGCTDLFAHHGERNGDGIVRNSCPQCGWFSEDISDWQSWDGNVPDSLIEERNGTNGTQKYEIRPLTAAKIDLALRIIYTFRKLFPSGGIKDTYEEIAKRLVDWELQLTTQDGIDGLVQVLVAVAASDILDKEEKTEAAFAPRVFLAIVNEACARAARAKFRMMTEGDEQKAQALASKRVSEMLCIYPESAPDVTESLLEAEPQREDVERSCSCEFALSEMATEDQEWAKEIVQPWCSALGIVMALRKSISKRRGGWKKLEKDIETSMENYADVVNDLQNAPMLSIYEACEIEEHNQAETFTAMAAQAYLYSKGASRHDLSDVRSNDTLCDMARDLRMRIYTDRVAAKMRQWANEGEQLSFLRARAADIGQYTDMVQASTHVHGLDKATFWGLWEAAVHDGHGGEKVRAFLNTANEGFHTAHAPSGGALQGRKRRKGKKKRTKA